MQVYTKRVPAWVGILTGVFLIAAGAGLIVWPFVTASSILAVIFGVALIATGVGMVARPAPAPVSTVTGIVFIITGILATVLSEFTAAFLVAFFGACIVLVGVFLLTVSLRLGQPLLIVGAVCVLLGGVFTLIFPEVALGIVAVFIGVLLIGWGIRVIITWFRRRKYTHTATRL